jgi:hypothetical protein
MGGSPGSQADAVALARSVDVLAMQPSQPGYVQWLPAMRAANPNLTALEYVNATNSQQSTSYPSSWYSVTASGQRIYPLQFPGNRLMDPSNPGWVSTVAQECGSAVARVGATGCFLDTAGPAPVGPGYESGQAIDRSTGRPWTASDWLAAVRNLIGQVQAANPAAVIVANGLQSGSSYFDQSAPTSSLFGVIDAAMSETFLRVPTDGVNAYPSANEWLRDVNMLVAAGAQGKSVLTTTKLWTSATSQQIAGWNKYALASFLMGTNGRAFFSFLPDHSPASPLEISAYDRVAIGQPTGAYAKSGSVYVRSFSGGVVVVNPTRLAATVRLSEAYTTLDGKRVSGTYSLPPESGDVLRPASGSTAGGGQPVSSAGSGAPNDCAFTAPTVGVAAVTRNGLKGHLTVDSRGQVCAAGAAAWVGDVAARQLTAPIIGITATASGMGYWLLGRSGGVYPFGDAGFFGSTSRIRLNAPVVGMAVTTDARGYWIVARDGGVFCFGDARFYGSTGSMKLASPVDGIAVAPGGHGYWLVAGDGGVFTFTPDGFYGSLGGVHLAKPIVGMTGTPDGQGYTLVGADGGVFSFGHAPFYGSLGSHPPSSPIVALSTVRTNNGYYLADGAGTVFTFGPGA